MARRNALVGRMETYVIDPALFTEPVPKATWVGACRDPSATVAVTSGDLYYRIANGGSITDPTYERTRDGLAHGREQLGARVHPLGPGVPPYPFCAETRPRPPAVASIGTLAPNATVVYQEHRYPESVQVLWTVVPRSVTVEAR